ncbi:retinol dehydrogenase 16 [Callospermophilus lateralis]
MWLSLVVLLGLYYLLRWYRERQVVSHLQDKYVFITGCDSGFGNLLARQLDMQGMRVLAACLTEEGAKQLRDRTSERLETVTLDVTNTESIAAATQWVKEHVGERACLLEPFYLQSLPLIPSLEFSRLGLWGLVNNAGIVLPTAPNEWLTKQDFVRVLEVNLLGMIEVTLSLLPLVRKARGRVVNVASILGRLSLCGGGYCISKYGVEAFSDSLRRDLFYFGVKVAIIEPGFFRTNILPLERFSQTLKNQWNQASSEVRETYGEKFLASYMKTIESLENICSEDLSLVTNCMEHALTACYPRTRYSAGWDAKLFYIPMSYLPTSLVDTIISWNAPKPEKTL